jgi:hypothetical protein
MIKQLRKEDITKLLPLMQEYYNDLEPSFRGDIPINFVHLTKSIESWLEDKQIFLFVKWFRDRIVGIVGFRVQAPYWNLDQFEAVEMLWYVTASLLHKKRVIFFKELFSCIQDTVRRFGLTKRLLIGVPVQNSVKNFLERQGFELCKLAYSKTF